MDSENNVGNGALSVVDDSQAELSNVVWTALAGAQAHLAQVHQGGRRYRPEFATFGAARDYTRESVGQIAQMLLPDERVTLCTLAKPQVPSGYKVVREASALQMVATRTFEASDDPRMVRLGADDVASMLALVELTDPGPFRPRTHEMGTYIGIRDGERLVAMTGERMIAGKYVEVSAVCVHPDWRGKGLAALLMAHRCAAIQRRGQIPFLHVFSDNASAIALYEKLGFQGVRTMHLTVLAR